MADRHAKKQRAVQAAHRLRYSLPHMSQSALAATLRELSARPLDASGLKRDDIRSERVRIAHQTTVYGPLLVDLVLPLEAGGECKVLYSHPLAMLHVAGRVSEAFSKLVKSSLERQPCTPASPWRLCIYSDEKRRPLEV